MASGRMEFHAKSIMQHTNFSFVLPNDFIMEEIREPKYYDRPTKTLILLHGLTGTDTDWLFGGVAQEMSKQYNLAVFMPTTGNSFYLDKGYPGAQCATFIGEELPDYIRSTFGYCGSREDTIIAGLSMGGFGAIHTALQFPDRFGACVALSSALVLYEYAQLGSRRNSIMPDQMLFDLFGEPSAVLASDINPEVLYQKRKAAGGVLPSLYLACGKEDSLHACNLQFCDFLKKENARYLFEDGHGVHDWYFWNEYLPRGLEWVLK